MIEAGVGAMKTSMKKHQNILSFIFLFSIFITLISPHIILVMITVFIGIILISIISSTKIVNNTSIPMAKKPLNNATDKISFFDDFRTDD